MKFFSLIISAVIFFNDPLFAMDTPPDEESKKNIGAFRLLAKEVIADVFEDLPVRDQRAMFYSSVWMYKFWKTEGLQCALRFNQNCKLPIDYFKECIKIPVLSKLFCSEFEFKLRNQLYLLKTGPFFQQLFQVDHNEDVINFNKENPFSKHEKLCCREHPNLNLLDDNLSITFLSDPTTQSLTSAVSLLVDGECNILFTGHKLTQDELHKEIDLIDDALNRNESSYKEIQGQFQITLLPQ